MLPKLDVWGEGRSRYWGLPQSCAGDRGQERGVRRMQGPWTGPSPGAPLMYAYEVSIVSLITLRG